MRAVVLLALIVLGGGAACGGTVEGSATAQGKTPTWVKEAAQTYLQGKLGDARPDNVRYIAGAGEFRVIYEFAEPVACTGCHKPWDSPVAKARTAKIVVDATTREAKTFLVAS